MSARCPDSEKFFQNLNCTCFPCHEGISEQNFNCLFCYCPLYALGRNCGGKFEITASGVKDCSSCDIPHRIENYDYMIRQSCRLIEKVRQEMENETHPPEREQ